MNCKVKWLDEGSAWICTRNLDGFKFPSSYTECFMTDCCGRQSYEDATAKAPRPIAPPAASIPAKICEHKPCDNPQALNRKYCGDACRKRSARAAYKQRQKVLKSSE